MLTSLNIALQRGTRFYIWKLFMARICQVTGKSPMVGNNVSHSNRKTKRRFFPNLHVHRLWLNTEQRFIKLRVSAHGLRIIEKRGLEVVVSALRQRGEKI